MITSTLPVKDLSRGQLDDIQTKLKKLGYYKDVVDGVFGRNTAHAWAEWKTDNFLDETELIGKASYELLSKQSRELILEQYIDWNDFDAKVSKYFTVGEVTLGKRDRMPTNEAHRKNVLKLAKELDKVREWWGSALQVTSWYRPPHVERAVGGSFANHPYGFAVDIAPVSGSVQELQRRFEAEWYKTGKWKGGFGRGASRGFIHLDLRGPTRRIWDY